MIAPPTSAWELISLRLCGWPVGGQTLPCKSAQPKAVEEGLRHEICGWYKNSHWSLDWGHPYAKIHSRVGDSFLEPPCGLCSSTSPL